MNSSYKDFFRSAIFDTIGEKYGIMQMQAGVFGFWETLLLEYFKTYGDADYNWCDIENIIKDTLLFIYHIFKGTPIGENNHYSSELINSLDVGDSFVRTSITNYVDKYCSSIFQNDIVQIKQFTDNEKLHIIYNRLLQELHNFEKRFCKYIRNNIVNPKSKKELNTSYIINAVNLLANLTEFSSADYKDIDDIIDVEENTVYEQIAPNLFNWVTKETKHLTGDFCNLKSTNILNFNYTALFDILEVKSPCVYSNVHGKLCNGNCSAECDSSGIIFGIDDALIQSEYTNTDLRLFSKTYRKMLKTSAPISVLPPNNNTPLEIKFYGHSLSEADYSYFQSIFDFYDLYSNNNVSLIFYYSKGFEQNDEIYRLIHSYGKTLSNQEQGKNLIHKLLLENRLKIVEIS